MSWKPEVQVDGKWCQNGLAFETEKEASANARDLMSRWVLVQDSRSVESEETPNYTFHDNTLKPIKVERSITKLTYKTEFPDYALTVEIPEGFEDNSWHNDATPSWVKTLKGSTLDLTLWIDYENPADRELPVCNRFAVELIRDGADVIAYEDFDNYADTLEALARIERENS